MKKLFCFVAFLFALTTMAVAQLNVTYSVNTKPEKIKVIQFSYSWLYKTSTGYEIWVNTDNHFDRYYNVLQLGETPAQCVQTLMDLHNLIENQVPTVEAQQGERKLIITTCTQLGIKIAWFRVDGLNAGKSWVSKNQVSSLIEYFNSMLPKVSEEIPIDTITYVSDTIQVE